MNHRRYPTAPVSLVLRAFLGSLSPAKREKLGVLSGTPQAYISRAICGEPVPSAVGWVLWVYHEKPHLLSP